MSSLRLVPSAQHQQSTSLPTSLCAPSAPGVHDTLRAQQHEQTQRSSFPVSRHPLESRLAQWRNTQENLKMALLRRQFGLAEPVKRQMELRIVRAGEWRPAALGSCAGVHADILSGRDTELDWEDVFRGDGEMYEGCFHAEMEARAGMDW